MQIIDDYSGGGAEGLLVNRTDARRISSIIENLDLKDDWIFLQVIFCGTSNVRRIFEFSLNWTVKEAIQFILRNKKLDVLEEESKDVEINELEVEKYGIFVPAWFNISSVGWLPEHSKLREFKLKHLETVEFRLKIREITIRNESSEFGIQIDDTLTIESIISEIIKQIGIDKIRDFETYPNSTYLAKLYKKSLLLHIPLPSTAKFVILENHRSNKELTLEQNCSLYLEVPSLSGYLYKRGEKGLVNLWKKRWFSIRKDKLYYFKSKNEVIPINFIDIRTISSINVFEPDDITSWMNAKDCFSISTKNGRIYYLIAAESESDQLIDTKFWVKKLNDWHEYAAFFGPSNNYLELWFKQSTKNLDSLNNKNNSNTENNNIIENESSNDIKSNEKRKSIISNSVSSISLHTANLYKRFSSSFTKKDVNNNNNNNSNNNLSNTNDDESIEIADNYDQLQIYNQQNNTHNETNEITNVHIEENDKSSSPETQLFADVISSPPENTKDLIEIKIETQSGKIVFVSVNPQEAVYDIVFSFSDVIPIQDISPVSVIDQSDFRTSELLDHQQSLANQSVPSDATYELKKTSFIMSDRHFSNCFLYVKLPELRGTLLLCCEEAYSSNKIMQFWFHLTGNKLVLYIQEDDYSMCYFVPLYMIKSLSSRPSPFISQLLLQYANNDHPNFVDVERIQSQFYLNLSVDIPNSKNSKVFHLFLQSVSLTRQFKTLLEKWLPFYTDPYSLNDRNVIEYQFVGEEVSSLSTFFWEN